MVATKNKNNLFANRFFGLGMNVRRILYNFQHAKKIDLNLVLLMVLIAATSSFVGLLRGPLFFGAIIDV
jgi:hypothetical protein